MKKIINKFGLLFATATLLFSCSDADNVVYDVFDGQSYGAVLRTRASYGISYNISKLETSTFGVKIEEQDEEYGALLSEVKVYLNYTDNNFDGANSKAEVLFNTIPVGSFSTSTRGLPETDIYVSLQEALDTFGFSPTDILPKDSFTIRLELILTDGRVFSNESTSGSLQGSYFASPFAYTAAVLCAPKPGDYRIEMHDSFGDGWQTDASNGGKGIQVELTKVDGTEETLEVGMCSPYGGSNLGTFMDESLGGCVGPASSSFYDATGYITIPDGAEEAIWTFPGDEYGEISFEIYGPDGDLLIAVEETGKGSKGLLEVVDCAI